MAMRSEKFADAADQNERRMALGLTMAEIAAYANLNYSTVSRAFNGHAVAKTSTQKILVTLNQIEREGKPQTKGSVNFPQVPSQTSGVHFSLNRGVLNTIATQKIGHLELPRFTALTVRFEAMLGE